MLYLFFSVFIGLIKLGRSSGCGCFRGVFLDAETSLYNLVITSLRSGVIGYFNGGSS